MYTTRTIIVSLSAVALLLLVLISTLLFRTETPRDRSEPPAVTPTVVSQATSGEPEVLSEERAVSQEENPAKELPGSDFNMEFPTLDEGVSLE